MIQYPDDTEHETSLPLFRWNENGFTIPLFEESSNNDQAGNIYHVIIKKLFTKRIVNIF